MACARRDRAHAVACAMVALDTERAVRTATHTRSDACDEPAARSRGCVPTSCDSASASNARARRARLPPRPRHAVTR